MRLNKYLSHCAIGTRRQTVEFIRKKKVTVNGKVIDYPGYIVQPNDEVTYAGKKLFLKVGKAYVLMNKPKDFTIEYDLENEKSVAYILKDKIHNIVVAPLPLNDKDRGLILLTDDEKVHEKMKNPEHRLKQIFQLTLDKDISQEDIIKLESGLNIDGEMHKLEGISYLTDQPQNIIGVECHNPNLNKLRKMFQTLGYFIEILDRTYIAGLTKKDLPRGFFRKLTEKEIIFLRHFF